jgi:cation diffusion facilitator CzcD-associated flavoprotein CzcO
VTSERSRHHVAIVGAGVGGLGLAMRLEPTDHEYVVLERGAGVGGTWRWNTYPGAACDVPSHLYSYADRPNPYWSRAYARQPEILEYLERCADEAGVRERIRTGWEVARAEWDDDACTWTLTSATGDVVIADVVVFATGMFAAPRLPDIDGLGDFAGHLLHSARWDHSVEVTGRRVGIVGTGASAIQIFPEVARVAAHTSLFQRTPPYVIPRPDTPFTPEEHERFANDPAALAKVRQDLYDMFEGTVAFTLDAPVAEVLKGMALDHLAEHVADRDLRAKLTPEYPLGCNRTLVSTEFYEAIVRDDVALVTEGIERVEPEGVRTSDGGLHELDVLVLATGFQVGEYLHGIEVRGRAGARLQERWSPYPHAYLGMTVTDFPNLFVFYGPNTNQGGNSIILILEAQGQYVHRALDRMAEEGVAAVDVRRDVLDAYDRELAEAMAGTVWSTGCHSYFIGAGGRVVTQLPQTSSWYAARTAEFDLESYDTRRAADRQLEPRT